MKQVSRRSLLRLSVRPSQTTAAKRASFSCSKTTGGSQSRCSCLAETEPETSPSVPEVIMVMRPPVEGFPWLGLNMPSKISDNEVGKWIAGLPLNGRKVKLGSCKPTGR